MEYQTSPTYQNTGKLSEKEILSLLTRAQHFELCRQVEEAENCLKPLWSDYAARPQTESYSKPLQGEILLRCGSLLSFISHFKQLPYQEAAQNLLTESREIFAEIGNADKIAEAESELGMAYWREGRYDEALAWLRTAGEKISNPINSVSIKNISYLILVYFSINSAESIQNGMELIKEKDIYAELSNDSRVKVFYYNNSALIMSRLDKLPETLDRHEKTRRYCEEVGNLTGLALAENNIGFAYKELKQFDKALAHATAGLEIFVKLGITVKQGDCWDTLAQIYLEQNELEKALTCAEKSLEILEEFDCAKAFPRVQVKTEDYPSLINSLNTKARILLKQNQIAEALMVFTDYYQLAKTRIGEAVAESYARSFCKLIYIQAGSSLDEETYRFEKQMLAAALGETGGIVARAAVKLNISGQRLAHILDERHGELREKFNVETGRVLGRARAAEKDRTAIKSKNLKPAASETAPREFKFKGFPVLIPNTVRVAFLMPIISNRLANVGLTEGRLAVVSYQKKGLDRYPAVVRDKLNKNVYYGNMTECAGLIGIESDQLEPLAFMPDEIEILGRVIGFCEFDVIKKNYQYSPINIEEH